jgi:CBS domain-containing protein
MAGVRRDDVMKCADIMNRNLESLTETDTVARAASVMAEAGIGFLPICDNRRRVIGVVTDRDLVVRALAKRIPPDTTSAAMVMSAPALTCLDTADVHAAEALMASERKSRLVIVDASGELVGILSLADLVEHAPRKETLDTLQAVLWREALGPRAGAAPGDPLLKDDPVARALPIPPDDAKARPTVFTGGNRETSTKEFGG